MSDEVNEGTPRVKHKKDGRLTITVDGTEVHIATFKQLTGHLEYKSKEFANKYHQSVISKIGTKADGKEVSGLTVKSVSIEGEADEALPKNAPKRPRMGPLGDCTPAVVDWYFQWRPKEAIIRYGVYVDEKGQPVRKHARRLVKNIVDRRDEDDDNLEWVKDGKKSQTKAPVREESEIIDEPDAIIARRSTHLTFTPQEVVGGFETDDEMAGVAEEDES